MKKYLTEGLPVDFSTICPQLKNNVPKRPIGFIFEIGDPDVLASEAACPNEGLPGVERRNSRGLLVPTGVGERIFAYCAGCAAFPAGFEEDITPE